MELKTDLSKVNLKGLRAKINWAERARKVTLGFTVKHAGQEIIVVLGEVNVEVDEKET